MSRSPRTNRLKIPWSTPLSCANRESDRPSWAIALRIMPARGTWFFWFMSRVYRTQGCVSTDTNLHSSVFLCPMQSGDCLNPQLPPFRCPSQISDPSLACVRAREAWRHTGYPANSRLGRGPDGLLCFAVHLPDFPGVIWAGCFKRSLSRRRHGLCRFSPQRLGYPYFGQNSTRIRRSTTSTELSPLKSERVS